MNRYLPLLPLAVLATVRCGASAGAPTDGPTANDAGATDAGATSSNEEGGSPWTSAEDAAVVAQEGGEACGGGLAGDSGSVDPPDPEGLDTNCDGADGIVGRDVYVSVDVGADTNPGTPSAPLRTITAALTLAATTSGNVLVLNGTYPVTTFANSGRWAIYGGYPSGFVGQPNRQTTTLTAPDTGLLISAASDATLAHLTVEGDMPSSLTQPSAHALRSSATRLALVDVLLRAGDGLPAVPAQAGATGANGVDDEGPLYCNGIAQPGYTYGACCAESAVEGKPIGSIAWGLRAQGSAGNPGTDGADATGKVSLSGGLLIGDTGQQGQSNGTPGYGASTGGANSGGWSWTSPTNQTPGPFSGGNGGSGGCPGGGGYGGSTGGASVALVVLAGTVTIQGAGLQAGLGGDGGDGGGAGAGGNGGQGTIPYFVGTPTPSYFTQQTTCSTAPGATNPDPLGVGCAEYGGLGGAGGVGGHGGGGAGGSTFGVVTVGSATCAMDSSTTVTLGEPGSGGVGNGGGRAPNGQRAETLHLN